MSDQDIPGEGPGPAFADHPDFSPPHWLPATDHTGGRPVTAEPLPQLLYAAAVPAPGYDQ